MSNARYIPWRICHFFDERIETTADANNYEDIDKLVDAHVENSATLFWEKKRF